MKKFIPITFLLLATTFAKAQIHIAGDTIHPEKRVFIYKDSRIDLLAKKEAEFNEAIANGPRTTRGFRLMLLSTNDRTMAMNLRSQLLQRYPEQKVYMSFQPPYIKLKFGNFLDKSEADQYRKEIVRNNLVSNNIYIVPEMIEIKGDKNKEKEIL